VNEFIWDPSEDPAAEDCSAVDRFMVKLLLDLGADPNLRDPTYNGRPLNWAEHNQQQHVVDYLRARTRKEP